VSDVAATILVAVVMAVGLAGTLVPLLPGLTLIWVAALAYGVAVGFGPVGVGVMVLSSALVIAGVVKSVLVPKRVADGHDVARWSQLVAAVCAVIGFFVIPVIGVVVGALVGLLVAEYANHRALGPAWQATVVVAKGFGLSAVIELGLGLVMVGLWSVWATTVLL
jgi:uncharacterized protein YqgC (DUF456 family)